MRREIILPAKRRISRMWSQTLKSLKASLTRRRKIPRTKEVGAPLEEAKVEAEVKDEAPERIIQLLVVFFNFMNYWQ
jgi:hypothetical protein